MESFVFCKKGGILAKGHKKLIIVSILAYFVFLLAMLPLNVVYQVLQPKLPVQVLSVGGTIWNGELVVKHNYTGQLNARWSLSILPLLWGSVEADVEADSNTAELKGLVTFNGLSGELTVQNLDAFVQASLINRFLRANRTSIQGDVELSKAQLAYNLFDRQANLASGNVIWAGGDVNYPKGRKKKTANLPMLVAKLNAEGGELKATVTTTEGQPVAKAYVKPDGWAGVSVMKRMVDLVGEPWPNKAAADSVILDVSERLFTVK